MSGDPAIRAVAALEGPLRQAMFSFIRAAGGPVTRDEAAEAVGISRKLAAFHLDKLVDAGALRADYRPATGIRKVGRAPKVYWPTEADIRISIPPRRHELLIDILLDAVLVRSDEVDGAADADTDTTHDAYRAAHQRGYQIGIAERGHTRPGRLGAERALTAVVNILQRQGFEPRREASDCVRLRSCPFHPAAAKAPTLVCGINQAFLAGLIEGFGGADALEAALVPRPEECCVELRSPRRSA
ncbi:helix-turn-helix transcriptional regulator [Pseudonocardia halophobica]|uniref:helix-turn-helix transcriptional regulator n=1 Tax=Pseudonocardia halophobica TaxID=29401 RepID=UPI003D8BF1D5